MWAIGAVYVHLHIKKAVSKNNIQDTRYKLVQLGAAHSIINILHCALIYKCAFWVFLS